MIIKIPRAYIKAMPASLLEGTVNLKFELPLNDETMALRAQLAMLKILDTAIALEITSPQGMLGDGTQMPPAEKVMEAAIDQSADFGGGADEDEDDASGSFGDAVFSTLTDNLEAIASENAPVTPHGGTTSVTYKGKTVTMTNDQFSKAARRIEKEGRDAAARTNGKTKRGK